jgi:hypothetical protein
VAIDRGLLCGFYCHRRLALGRLWLEELAMIAILVG